LALIRDRKKEGGSVHIPEGEGRQSRQEGGFSVPQRVAERKGKSIMAGKGCGKFFAGKGIVRRPITDGGVYHLTKEVWVEKPFGSLANRKKRIISLSLEEGGKGGGSIHKEKGGSSLC